MNSQPPPSAMPSTAETVGTIAYFHACVVAWNCATTPSTFSSRPAISASATLSLRAAFSTMDSASRRKPFIILAKPEGFWSDFGLAEGPCRVRPERERRLGLPDDQALEAALPFVDRLQDTVEHVLADRVHLALEADHADVVAGGPHAHRVGLEDGLAVVAALSHQTIRERLAPIHRQRRPRPVGIRSRAVRALRRVHAGAALLQRPGRKRHRRHAAAGGDVFLDPCSNALPAGRLPDLEGALVPAEAPAHGQIEVARVVGDLGQVVRAVVQHVAERSPQELSPADASSRAASGSARRCRGS